MNEITQIAYHERLKNLPCNCRPSPEGIEASFPQTHEPDCSYRVGREAANDIGRMGLSLTLVRNLLKGQKNAVAVSLRAICDDGLGYEAAPEENS